MTTQPPPGRSAPPDDTPRATARYEILERLGRGAMGAVYKARDTELDRLVAIKFLAPGTEHDPQALERFRKEAQLASKLSHQNICAIFDVGQSDSGAFIVMELLEGESLRARLSRGPLAPAELLQLATQAADGLAEAHRHRVVHRDIKPENLFILSDGTLKILDFGIAKLQRSPTIETHTATTRLTERGFTPGTLPYMSPEQVRGEEVDWRSDLFSLASVIFEMATARPAFTGRSGADLQTALLTFTPMLPALRDAAFRRGLAIVLSKGFEKKREYRSQDAADVAADLRRLARDLERGLALPDGPAVAWQAPARPPTLRRLILGDLLRGVVVLALAYGAQQLLAQSAAGPYLEQFQLALLQPDLEHGPLSPGDFQSGGRLLPLVVDVSAVHRDKTRPTDRGILDDVITSLRQNGAAAVGIDLSFDNVEGTDFRYLQRWAQHGNVRVGIYKRFTLGRGMWLGRPEFASLAAGIAMPADNPQTAFAYLRRWSLRQPLADADRALPRDCDDTASGNCKDDLYQLPVALWLVSERRVGTTQGGRDTPEARIGRLLQHSGVQTDARSSSEAFETGDYTIDYSFLKDLRREIVPIMPAGDSAAGIATQLATLRSRIADRVVLVGDLEDTSDHLCHTPGSEALPGVLVHACALATWTRTMLLQPGGLAGQRATWWFAAFVAVIIAVLRVLHTLLPFGRHIPHQPLETVVFIGLAVALVWGARWLSGQSGIAWLDYFWLAAGLIAYSVSEPLARSLRAVPVIARLAATTVGRSKQGA